MSDEGNERCPDCGEPLVPGDITGERYSHVTGELSVTGPLVCENPDCPGKDTDMAKATEVP